MNTITWNLESRMPETRRFGSSFTKTLCFRNFFFREKAGAVVQIINEPIHLELENIKKIKE